MAIAFLIFYVLFDELTYMVAVHQQLGLVRHISAGDLCWINRIIMAVACVRYVGWIGGALLIAFAFFGILHATIGWVVVFPTLFVNDEDKIVAFTEFECGLLLPVDIIALVFTVASFFFDTNKSILNWVLSDEHYWNVITVLVVGFIARFVVSSFMVKRS